MTQYVHFGAGTNWEVDRKIFSDEDIYQDEVKNIFGRAWLYVGHESQIPNVGDYIQTKMGEDPMILVRDKSGKPQVMLNSCRHRGMRVCRYDEGNTKMFYCPYHAWSYDLQGKLVGLPAQQTSYVGHFDKKDWGLIKAAQVATFRGTVWATWDASAPSFETYLGDLRDDLALAFGPWDGGDGDVEVLGGTQKWILKSNWKIVAENCGGDTLHDVSHRSVDLARIGAHGGLGRRDPFGDLFLTYGPEGHGTLFERFDHKAPRNHYQASPATAEYFQEQWRKRVERLGEKAGAQMVLGNIFPSSGFHVREPRSFASIFPRGPHETEIWRVYFVDKKAPQEVKDYLRRYYMRYAGPGGMTEQDDMENWVYATEACAGTKASSLSFHYGAAIDQTHKDKLVPGNVSDQFHSEQNARQLYVRWNQFMAGDDWKQLTAGVN